jgi:hypothetical protein
MKNPLPTEEIRELLGDRGFLRLYGQDTHYFISDIPRRVAGDELAPVLQALIGGGFTGTPDPGGLLLIDMQPERWKALLKPFRAAGPAAFPQDETLHGVYALARLLWRHPAAFELQPMDMLRAALKRYAEKDGLKMLAPRLHARCAELLRQGKPLPSALAGVLTVWLNDLL